MGSTGVTAGKGYSTSIAWRSWYQPQLPHTTCGVFAAPHRGQTLRDGALSVHADARRLRLFIFDVFFLGTAIANGGLYRSAAELVELQLAERGPAGIDLVLSGGADGMAFGLRAGAGLFTQWRQG